MKHYFQQLSRKVVTSIAFLPSVISLLFLLFSLLIVYLHDVSVELPAGEGIQVLLVKGNDNARQVLSAIIGGIISLTVFSFSTVLLLLNQASSSFTPRILPGLLTDKKHQFVLGFYIGTIIYCIILILNIQPGEASQNSPKFGVLLAMVSGIACLALFIYFIHLISLKLQVAHIIFGAARHSLDLLKKSTENNLPGVPVPGTASWHEVHSRETGYLNGIDTKRLRQLCQQYQVQMEVTQLTGTFVQEANPIGRVNRQMHPYEKLYRKILTCFTFSQELYGEGSYLYGVNQVSEIAVKSLSPGINDPGTALIAIDYLGTILGGLLQHEKEYRAKPQPETDWLSCKKHSLDELFFTFIQPISYYGRSDAKVQAKLLDFYHRLLPSADALAASVISGRIAAQWQDIQRNIASPNDLASLRNHMSR